MTTSKQKPDDVFSQVLTYAKERWCWDDETFLKEQFDRLYQATTDTPTAFVDELARDYDLTDPHDVGMGF